jgi:hypothetical protein
MNAYRQRTVSESVLERRVKGADARRAKSALRFRPTAIADHAIAQWTIELSNNTRTGFAGQEATMIAMQRQPASLPFPRRARGVARSTVLFFALCLPLAAGACDELATEPEPVPAEPAPVSSSALVLVGSTLYTGEYTWSLGKLATPMGSVSGRVCFLTHIGGTFQAKGDWVGIVASGGNWYLTGASTSGHVYAGARCIMASSYSGEVRVIGANATTGRAALPTRACGITRAGGTFNGGFDGIRIHDDRTISAHSEFGWVEAGARCAGGDIIPDGGEYVWYYSSGAVQMQTTSARLCVLGAMIGAFESSADVFLTYQSNGYWYLWGAPTHGSDYTTGRCMRKNPRLR